MEKVRVFGPETPALGVPTKYYFVGCPFAGVTAW
jgi:hypothetical protein